MLDSLDWRKEMEIEVSAFVAANPQPGEPTRDDNGADGEGE